MKSKAIFKNLFFPFFLSGIKRNFLKIFQGQDIKCLIDSEKTGALRCGTFNASDSRQLAVGDFVGKMNIIDLERHEKPVYSRQFF